MCNQRRAPRRHVLRAMMLSGVMATLSACGDQMPGSGAAAPAINAAQRTADGLELLVSPSAPRTGDTVTVTVRLPLTMSAAEVGAFTVMMHFDQNRLRYVGDPTAMSMQHLTNVRSDGLQVAGASLSGLTSRELARERFVAVQEMSTGDLSISLRELTTPDLRDLRNVLRTR